MKNECQYTGNVGKARHIYWGDNVWEVPLQTRFNRLDEELERGQEFGWGYMVATLGGKHQLHHLIHQDKVNPNIMCTSKGGRRALKRDPRRPKKVCKQDCFQGLKLMTAFLKEREARELPTDLPVAKVGIGSGVVPHKSRLFLLHVRAIG